jgi:hypothetical protein
MMKKIELIPENYPENYNGYRFVSLVKYNEKPQITIIDNVIADYIQAFVLDECQPLNLDENTLLSYAEEWYMKDSNKIPFSIFLAKNNIGLEYYKIIKLFPLHYVSRVLGPLFSFNMGNPIKIKRKRKKDIPENIEVVYKGRIIESPNEII